MLLTWQLVIHTVLTRAVDSILREKFSIFPPIYWFIYFLIFSVSVFTLAFWGFLFHFSFFLSLETMVKRLCQRDRCPVHQLHHRVDTVVDVISPSVSNQFYKKNFNYFFFLGFFFQDLYYWSLFFFINSDFVIEWWDFFQLFIWFIYC